MLRSRLLCSHSAEVRDCDAPIYRCCAESGRDFAELLLRWYARVLDTVPVHSG